MYADPSTDEQWFDGKESSKLLSEDLKPFFSPEGGFWNSSRAEHTASFGYIYSDVKRDSPTTRDHFRDMHAWSLRPQPEPLHWQPTPPEGMIPLDLSNAQVYDGHPEYLKPIQPKGSAMSLPVAITSTQISSLESASEVVLPKLNIEHLDASPSGQYKEWFVDNEVERYVTRKKLRTHILILGKTGARWRLLYRLLHWSKRRCYLRRCQGLQRSTHSGWKYLCLCSTD